MFKVFFVSHLEKLKSALTKRDLAALLGYNYKAFTYLIYEVSETPKYTEFEISKKSGGTRQIFAPNDKLKLLQRRLADLLLACDDEIHKKGEYSKRGRTAIAHGFKKGMSIMTNADQHIGKRYIVNLDLENFFPTFNFGRVRGFFLKDKNFQLTPSVATAIAQIACYKNHLPQGSPSSPVISNLISRYLDIKLLHFSKLNGCTYTRYADDISISTNAKELPKSIARNETFLISHKWVLGKELRKIIHDSGFTINETKTRVQYRAYRQEVTGLTVNKIVNVKKEYYRNVRAMCNSLFQRGHYFVPNNDNRNVAKERKYNAMASIFSVILFRKKNVLDGTEDKFEENILQSNLDFIEGRLNYIYEVKKYRNKFAKSGFRQNAHHIRQITKKNEETASKQLKFHRLNNYHDEHHKKAINGIKNLYSKFLFYKNFYIPSKPVVVCEGKTDYVYLECAYNQLRDEFKSLTKEVEGKNSSEKAFKFLKLTHKNMDLMFNSGGTGNLRHLLDIYSHYLKKSFKSVTPEMQNPVIVILDNDTAGRKILENYSQTYESGKISYKLYENVFAVIIPAGSDPELDRPIEYLFEEEVLNTKHNGKDLYLKNKGHDNAKHYSKHIFAEQVIKKSQSEINFENFKPLLGAINEIITEHSVTEETKSE